MRSEIRDSSQIELSDTMSSKEISDDTHRTIRYKFLESTDWLFIQNYRHMISFPKEKKIQGRKILPRHQTPLLVPGLPKIVTLTCLVIMSVNGKLYLWQFNCCNQSFDAGCERVNIYSMATNSTRQYRRYTYRAQRIRLWEGRKHVHAGLLVRMRNTETFTSNHLPAPFKHAIAIEFSVITLNQLLQAIIIVWETQKRR